MSTLAADFADKYGPWALVAGASEGIGEEFARQLAAEGINLVLLSRSQDKLDRVEAGIKSDFSVETRTISADLTSEDFINSVADKTADIEVGLLIYNAGAMHGADLFLDNSVDQSLKLVNLNCRGPVLLAHHFGQLMRQRKKGGMIFLSSLAAFCGGSYVTTYAATKSFDIIFAQGLWHEMAACNVDVLSLIAGATKTPAMAASGLDFEAEPEEGAPVPMESADVAREGLENIANGPVWVPGENNREMAKVFTTLPREQAIEGMSMATANMYDKPYIPVKPLDLG